MPYSTAVALTVKSVAQAGVAIGTLQTPDGTLGNKFSADTKTVLRVKNAGAQITVTIEAPGTVRGLAIADATFVIPATTGDVLIPIIPEYWQPGTQDVYVTYSSVTSVTVDVYQIPSL